MRKAWPAWMALLPQLALAGTQLPQYMEVATKYAYLVSDSRGRFYARATPPADGDDKGSTRIYRTREQGDDSLLMTYRWFVRPEALVLCGDPETNQVGVAIYNQQSGRDIRKVENVPVLRLFGAGELLATYGVRDLEKMGAKLKRLDPERHFYVQDYRMEGCLRVSENVYVFSLRTGDDQQVMFDSRTGEVVTATPRATDPAPPAADDPQDAAGGGG